MGADQGHDIRALAASTLAWWQAAGVDVLVEEMPRDWLAPPSKPIAASAPAPVAAAVPDTLEAFVAWRYGADAPEAGRGTPILPEGDAAAPLMVLVDCPDDDGLLSGAPGRLFDRMLAAIGLARADVYLASVATVRPAGGRIAPEQLGPLGELAARHVHLARPKAVLVLGDAASRALWGTDRVAEDGSLRAIHLNGTTVAAVASRHPRALIDRPAMKASVWRDLGLLKGELR